MTDEQGRTILHEMTDERMAVILDGLIERNAPANEVMAAAMKHFKKRFNEVKPADLQPQDVAAICSGWLETWTAAFKHFRAERSQLTVRE